MNSIKIQAISTYKIEHNFKATYITFLVSYFHTFYFHEANIDSCSGGARPNPSGMHLVLCMQRSIKRGANIVKI